MTVIKDGTPPNFRTLDLNLLRVFDEVMAERSLTRAARNLSLTQPAVSNALRRLRVTLDDELVRRSGHGIEPTPRALALWPSVREALRQLQAALVPDRFVPATASSVFVIAMADSTAAALMPPIIEVLDREAPGVSLRVMSLTTRDPRKLLDEQAADLAVGYFPALLADLSAREQSGEVTAFAHQRLYAGRYVCVMRRGHPLAEGPLTLDRYCSARHLLVSLSGQPYGFIDAALAAQGRQRRIVLTMNHFFTAGRVVARSNLLTILPSHFVPTTGLADQLEIRELPIELPPVHVEAVWHRRLQHDSGHQWLRAMVQGITQRSLAELPAREPEATP